MGLALPERARGLAVLAGARARASRGLRAGLLRRSEPRPARRRGAGFRRPPRARRAVARARARSVAARSRRVRSCSVPVRRGLQDRRRAASDWRESRRSLVDDCCARRATNPCARGLDGLLVSGDDAALGDGRPAAAESLGLACTRRPRHGASRRCRAGLLADYLSCFDDGLRGQLLRICAQASRYERDCARRSRARPRADARAVPRRRARARSAKRSLGVARVDAVPRRACCVRSRDGALAGFSIVLTRRAHAAREADGGEPARKGRPRAWHVVARDAAVLPPAWHRRLRERERARAVGRATERARPELAVDRHTRRGECPLALEPLARAV